MERRPKKDELEKSLSAFPSLSTLGASLPVAFEGTSPTVLNFYFHPFIMVFKGDVIAVLSLVNGCSVQRSRDCFFRYIL